MSAIQYALVTGATGELGMQAAIQLARNKVTLVLSSRNPMSDGRILELVAYGAPAVHCVIGNLLNKSDALRMIPEASQIVGGRLDTVICAHGDHSHSSLLRDVEKDIDYLMRLNCYSNHYLAASWMRFRQTNPSSPIPRMGIISSSAALGSRSGDTAYAASKGAVNAFVWSCGRYAADGQALITAIAPGPIKSKMTQDRGYADQDLLTRDEVIVHLLKILEFDAEGAAATVTELIKNGGEVSQRRLAQSVRLVD